MRFLQVACPSRSTFLGRLLFAQMRLDSQARQKIPDESRGIAVSISSQPDEDLSIRNRLGDLWLWLPFQAAFIQLFTECGACPLCQRRGICPNLTHFQVAHSPISSRQPC